MLTALVMLRALDGDTLCAISLLIVMMLALHFELESSP